VIWFYLFLFPHFLKCFLGFPEIKKVDILWNDRSKVSRYHHGSSGELYLRVFMSGDSIRTNLWSLLKNYCIQIMDMIDWSRSHPDNIHDFCVAYGIDAGWKYFLNVRSLC
jgi:DNA-directed RNA polymerase-4 subunit 1